MMTYFYIINIDKNYIETLLMVKEIKTKLQYCLLMHLLTVFKVAAAISIVYGHRDHHSSLMAWASDESIIGLVTS